MSDSFVVSVRFKEFLVKWEGDIPSCTQIPSYAVHVDYLQADRIVCSLQARGFEQAHVCHINGTPATPQSIADAQQIQNAWPKTTREFMRMDPDLARRLNLSNPEFRRHIASLK
jgi:hypothetical protein